MNTNVRNILSVYEQATEAEVAVGMTWYTAAWVKASEYAKLFKTPISMSAGVIAALSPNQSWGNNVRSAWKLLDMHTKGLVPKGIAAYPASVDRAVRILQGEKPTQVLKGLKTASFYKNIVAPWTSTSVTVDGHAYSVWMGERITLQQVPSKIFRPKWYNAIAADYKVAATELKIKPWQCQAVTWCAWRRINEVSKNGRYDL